MIDIRLRSPPVLLSAVAAALLAACGDPRPAATPDTAAADAAAAAQTHMDAAMGADLQRAVREYRLTMPRMEQYIVAVRNLHELERRNPEIRQRMEAMADQEDRTLEEMTAMIQGEPQLRQAIERSGMSVREYMLTSLAFMQAMMAHEFQRQGYIQELPAEVSPENVAFIRDNEARLQPMLEELNRMGEGG